MMLSSLHAGLAFSNASLGLIHAMAHSLGGFLDLPHGNATPCYWIMCLISILTQKSEIQEDRQSFRAGT